MSDANHIDKIKAEQRELLKQFEQSLQDNFKRLMSNVSKPSQKNDCDDISDEDDDIDSNENFMEIEKRVSQQMIGDFRAKNDTELFEESSESEKPKRDIKVDKKEVKKDESRSNSEIEMVSKFSGIKDDDSSDNNDIIPSKNRKSLLNNSKLIKARTQNDFKPQVAKNHTTDLNSATGLRKPPLSNNNSGSIPLRSRTPQPVTQSKRTLPIIKNNNTATKQRARYNSNRSGTFSATNVDQKEIFNNSKLNTSINKKTKNSVVSVYSNKDEKNPNEYKLKYEKLAKEHVDLKEKFGSLYDKHQRLLKLFNKLEEKYRTQSDKLRSTNKAHQSTKPPPSKVTVPKTMTRPETGKRLSTHSRKV